MTRVAISPALLEHVDRLVAASPKRTTRAAVVAELLELGLESRAALERLEEREAKLRPEPRLPGRAKWSS